MTDSKSLADIETKKRASGIYEAHVKFGVFENSGCAEYLTAQMQMGTVPITSDLNEKSLHILDPFQKILFDCPESKLETLAGKNGLLWLIAGNIGAYTILRNYGLLHKDLEDQEVQYNGLIKLEPPQQLALGINQQVDTYVGNIDYKVTLREKK